MAKIYTTMTELIGRTPLLEVKKIEENLGLQARILVKLEYFNPAGSVKDRAALAMILDAEERGILKEGAVIIEPTSGNTGIGLAAIAAARGYRAVFTMPETMSVERRKLLQGYGAEIVLTEGKKGMKGAIEKAAELEREIEGAVVLGQFVNPANADAHYRMTGPEIWEDTEGNVDAFVAGVGTGGTITGTGKYLKEKSQTIEVVAVEPRTSAVLSGEQAYMEFRGLVRALCRRFLTQKSMTGLWLWKLKRHMRRQNFLQKKRGFLLVFLLEQLCVRQSESQKRKHMKGRQS